MYLLSIIYVTLLLKNGAAQKHTLPVFILDQDKVLSHIQMVSNPFEKITSGKFIDIIQETMRRSDSIIIFIEETFSVEDLTRKDKHGSPYFYMQQSLKDKKAKYLPSVVEPYSLLTHMFPPQDYNVFYLKSRKKLELIDSFKYIYIYFKDNLNETRIEILRRHDMIIREVCFAVRQLKSGPVIVFYTGKTNPSLVEKLHFIPITPNPIPKDMGVMIKSSGALFRFTGVYSASPTRRATFNQLPMISKETWTRRSLSTKMAYTDFELEFNFSFKSYGWILEDVALMEAGEEVGRTEMRVGAPWNMSYFCAEPLVIVNTRDGSVVTITKYKIQPRMKDFIRQGRQGDLRDLPELTTTEETTTRTPEAETTLAPTTASGDVDEFGSPTLDDGPTEEGATTIGEGEEGDVEFGKSTECTKYFSPGILSGLCVTFVCLLILIYGIVSIMDVNTNDRYEDPLSKPLTHPDN